MCLDWRVLTGLGAVAVGIWLVAPQYVLGALPLLLVLACPLSMVAMAVMMRGSMDGERTLSPAERLAALERKQAPRTSRSCGRSSTPEPLRAAGNRGRPRFAPAASAVV